LSLGHSVPTIGNELPATDILFSHSQSGFKPRLKTFLFNDDRISISPPIAIPIVVVDVVVVLVEVKGKGKTLI